MVSQAFQPAGQYRSPSLSNRPLSSPAGPRRDLRLQVTNCDFKFGRGEDKDVASNRSQIATLKRGRGQHRKYMPFAFTEHGALMAANVLISPAAVKMSVYVVRAFIKQRKIMQA